MLYELKITMYTQNENINRHRNYIHKKKNQQILEQRIQQQLKYSQRRSTADLSSRRKNQQTRI